MNVEEWNFTLDLFPFVARVLSVKSQRIAQFISLIYIAVITKLNLKSVAIKPISFEKFDELIAENKYEFDFFGDLHSCALLSINTLVSLSAINKSWLKITKLNTSFLDLEEHVDHGRGLPVKIEMPPVEVKENSSENYFIQCLCISNALQDFVLYVTDVKLFNITNQWNSDNTFCDLITQVKVECDVEHEFPCIAKYAGVSAIFNGSDIGSKDLADILHEYFNKPKSVRLGEIIRVDLYSCGDLLRSRTSLLNVSEVFYKVSSLKGQTDVQDQYIVKGYTELYLSPTVHSFLPSKKFIFIKTHESIPGFEIPKCPGGLLSYFKKLERIFKFLLKDVNSKRMILLTGARGSGKRTTVRVISDFFGLNFLQVNCFDFFGLNPSVVHAKLDQVREKAKMCAPCVIYFKNVELLGRGQNYYENARLIDLFETNIPNLWAKKSLLYPIFVVGSTHSKVSELVPAIARLFIHTVSFEAPKLNESFLMLKWLLKKSNMICSSQDLEMVVRKIRGYVVADLILLIQHAIHFQNQSSNLTDEPQRIIQFHHFKAAIDLMEAAYSDSIGAAQIPTVFWEDVGGLADLKEEIMLTLNLPLQHPELFNSGLKRSGILLYGPPGTGKTLMAKAVATECNYSFLSVKGPELMNMYVGQSEKNVREVFERAREASPCIIFFDELDSLASSRGRSGDSGGVTDRVVSQLLAEMDGLDKNKDLFVIAATNRPDLIDQALLRPGRFDKMFYVGVCKDRQSKLSVLKALTRRFNLGSDVDFEKIVDALPAQVTGADLYSVCSSAWFSAARWAIHEVENGSEPSLPLKVSSSNFFAAVTQFIPSLTAQDIEYYENLKSSGAMS